MTEAINILPDASESIVNDVNMLKKQTKLFNEIEALYGKCIRDGITTSKQEATDEIFAEFYDKYRSICKEPEFTSDNKEKVQDMLKQLKELQDIWFNKLLPSFRPKDFFDKKVDAIIAVLNECKKSSAEGFAKNALSEIRSLEYFKEQLSYPEIENSNAGEANKLKLIQPFPSFSPIFPYNLEDGGSLKNNFNEAMSKSQDLAEQFQEFKDFWFLLRVISIVFEMLRVDSENVDSNQVGYLYRIQYIAELLSSNTK